jgi:DNA-directed RNA polymerase subunit RPC12/RpoP
MSENGHERGLYEKYEVVKGGESIEGTFVLRPETDEAARKAILAYADAIDNEELADDLRHWITHYLNTDTNEGRDDKMSFSGGIDYTCSNCGAHYNQDIATAGMCPVCHNRRLIDRVKRLIKAQGWTDE